MVPDYVDGVKRVFSYWFVAALAGCVVLSALAVALVVGHDENYALQELVFRDRYARYDDLIRQAGERYGVDPRLIKAVIWRETKFQPDKVGAHGERGLMQITERAAEDWARAEKIENFVPTDLFDPKTNIEAGTWYLGRALRHWGGKDDPVPFALAEYNAGRTRVKRWEKEVPAGGAFGAVELAAVMDFPTTKKYIADIVARYREFVRDGEADRP